MVDETYKVIETIRCETVADLLGGLYNLAEDDPRGEEVGQSVAVHIENKCVQIELREFQDGTREIALTGI